MYVSLPSSLCIEVSYVLQGQDIPDISIVIRFWAVDSLEQLKQEMGRAGRDPQIFAQAHFLVEKSCFQAQKKSTRKKQKTTNAAAIDGGEPRDRPEANDAPAESIEFPLPDNLQWRKKLNPGVRHYAAAQHPDCRRDVSDEYFGNPVRERGAKRRGGHLTECKEIVERWATEMYEKDWADSGLTSDVFITDTMITYLAHNRFSSLAHLRNSLERSTRSWGLVEDYGNDVLRVLINDVMTSAIGKKRNGFSVNWSSRRSGRGRSVKQGSVKQQQQPGCWSGGRGLRRRRWRDSGRQMQGSCRGNTGSRGTTWRRAASTSTTSIAP
ncbi:hypothetical protein R3P38DRAFT_3341162 [Favolaschia claudopus]|uniref:Helicase C-terminal domain-containing protein n=1 Tax=Favolaschia claudopus TaxID=2862362 RepID=A0AAW0E7Y9_9AGAR